MSPKDDQDTAIHRYIDSLFTRYEAELRGLVAGFAEPVPEDRDRARLRLTYLVETLTAFAVGHAVGRVVEAVRRIDERLASVIAAAIASIDPPTLPAALPDLADHDRPLAGLLAARLQVRLCYAARHARLLVQALAAALAKRAPERVAMLGIILDRLAGDPTSAFAFGDQLALGWRFFTALVTGAPDPALSDEPRWQRGRTLWTAWSRKLRGTPAPCHDDELPPGYILRVA